MASAPQSYEKVARTLQYSLDTTLQNMSAQAHTRASVCVSAPILLASVYTSYAIQLMHARAAMSITSANAPSVISAASLSAHISDLTQAALDAVAAQASASRVELFITSPTTLLLTAVRTDGTQASRFVEAADTSNTPWYPSATYPIAALGLLIHVLSWLVHNVAQDSRVVIHPSVDAPANQTLVYVYFDATVPVDETSWPPWLGPYVDMQTVLDDIGCHLVQTPVSLETLPDKPYFQPLLHAQHPTCLNIILKRPAGSDLMSSEPNTERDVPLIAPGITVLSAMRIIHLRRVHFASPDDDLCRQLQEYLVDWQCSLVGLDQQPEIAIVHDDQRQLHAMAKAQVPCVFLAPLPRIVSVLQSMPPRCMALSEPISRARLAYAFYCLLYKDNGSPRSEANEQARIAQALPPQGPVPLPVSMQAVATQMVTPSSDLSSPDARHGLGLGLGLGLIPMSNNVSTPTSMPSLASSATAEPTRTPVPTSTSASTSIPAPTAASTAALTEAPAPVQAPAPASTTTLSTTTTAPPPVAPTSALAPASMAMSAPAPTPVLPLSPKQASASVPAPPPASVSASSPHLAYDSSSAPAPDPHALAGLEPGSCQVSLGTQEPKSDPVSTSTSTSAFTQASQPVHSPAHAPPAAPEHSSSTGSVPTPASGASSATRRASLSSSASLAARGITHPATTNVRASSRSPHPMPAGSASMSMAASGMPPTSMIASPTLSSSSSSVPAISAASYSASPATASDVVSDAADATTDYFTQAVSRLASHANTAGGRLVHGADGRPAGLYFQPRETPPDPGSRVSPRTKNKHASEPLSSSAPPPSYPSASMLRAAQLSMRGMPGVPSVGAFPPNSPQLPTTLSFSQRERGSRPGAPTSIHLPPLQFDPKAYPSRPTPYAHLPSRSVRTSAQPQEGVMIGVRDESWRRTNDAALSPPYAPPLSPQSSTRIQRRKMALREEFLPPVKVLIVEDNVINQRILATFLRRKRIDYDMAKDGHEAIDKWRRGNFHLILMDIQLPGLDGIQATKEIRRLEGQLRLSQQRKSPRSAQDPALHHYHARHSVIIVALTASVLSSDRVEALAAGCNDFLNKPVSLPWLQRKILEWGSMQYLLHAGLSPCGTSTTTPTFAAASESACPSMGALEAAFHRQADQMADQVARHLHLPTIPSPSGSPLPSPSPPATASPSSPPATMASDSRAPTPRTNGTVIPTARAASTTATPSATEPVHAAIESGNAARMPDKPAEPTVNTEATDARDASYATDATGAVNHSTSDTQTTTPALSTTTSTSLHN